MKSNDDDMNNPEKKKFKLKLWEIALVVILVVVLLVMIVFNNRSRDVVIMRCAGVDIYHSVYQMYVFECASDLKKQVIPEIGDEEYNEMSDAEKIEYLDLLKNFWTKEIDGKMPLEIAKERAMDLVKSHAHSINECEKNNIRFEGEELQARRSVIEAEFQSMDIEEAFGIKSTYFYDFMVELDRISKFEDIEMSKIDVSEELINEKFDLFRENYAVATVKTVFIKDKEEISDEEKKNFIYGLKDKLTNGEKTMDELIAEYSNFKGGNDGNFIVVNTSIIKKDFGLKYIESVLNSNKDDLKVVKTETGYCLNQIISIARTENAYGELKSMAQNEIYDNKIKSLLENEGTYKVTIVDQKLFDSIKLPQILLETSVEED